MSSEISMLLVLLFGLTNVVSYLMGKRQGALYTINYYNTMVERFTKKAENLLKNLEDDKKYFTPPDQNDTIH